ncbi:MAG: hypothetical protein V3T23_00785, partial [Nitrososphaerales archaeon]
MSNREKYLLVSIVHKYTCFSVTIWREKVNNREIYLGKENLMPKQSTLPTIAEAVERALAEVEAPTSLDALLSRILTIRPSKANNPTGSIRTRLRELEGRSLVYLDSKTISPLRVAAVGVRFRIPLSNPEVDQLALAISPGFDGWMSNLDDPQRFELIDDQDNRLPTKIVTIQKTINVGPL